jgi:hypothetical protein
MGSKYPNWSPYHYVARNPIRLIDPNGAEVAFADGNTEAREFHKKHYNEFNEEDGSKNEYYNKEYADIYDNLNRIKNILFYVNAKVDYNSAMYIGFRTDIDGRTLSLNKNDQMVVDIFYGNPKELHGGTALHAYMEEIYHCKQMLDLMIKGETNPNIIVRGTIENELKAKEWVAHNFKYIYNLDGTKELNYFYKTDRYGVDYEIPTEMGVMGGHYPKINRTQYLKNEILYIPYIEYKGNATQIGGSYSNYPDK